MLKIIQNEKIVDVINVPRYVKFLPTGHIATTDKVSAQGIASSDGKSIYSFIPTTHPKVVGIAEVFEISQAEYDKLLELLTEKVDISSNEDALYEAKQAVIRKLSNICKNTITAGFNVRLSDGEIYNFRLTTEDQLNLMQLENQLLAGNETFLFHATNQPCRFFTKTDMTKIINTFKRFITYHTTYFNIAKQHVNSMLSIDKVTAFEYGEDLSHLVFDKSIKQILRTGGTLE